MSLDLPNEVLYYNVLPYLKPTDILNLCRAGTIEVTKEVYCQIFHDHVNFDHYTLQGLEERAAAKLYLFGVLDRPQKRQGERSEQSQSKDSLLDEAPFQKMHSPYEVETGESAICQIHVDHGAVEIVTEGGQVYYTEHGSLCKLRTLVEWYHSINIGQHAIKSMYPELTSLDPNRFFVKAGNTTNERWAVDDKGLFWLKDDRLWMPVFDKPEVENLIASQADNTLSSKLNTVSSYGPFTQICTSGNHIGLLCENGTMIEMFLNTSEVRRVKGLRNIASIATGSAHSLALTKEGDVYSWGKDKGSGCLGHGSAGVQDTPTKVKLPGKAYAVYAGGEASAILINTNV